MAKIITVLEDFELDLITKTFCRYKEDIQKAVVLLDLFTKTFCRYGNDMRDLEFRCDECPFRKENDECLVKIFKNKYAPDYEDFGSMGDL